MPCYRKGDRAMRRIYGCPGQFRKSMAMPTATISVDCMKVRTKLELRSK